MDDLLEKLEDEIRSKEQGFLESFEQLDSLGGPPESELEAVPLDNHFLVSSYKSVVELRALIDFYHKISGGDEYGETKSIADKELSEKEDFFRGALNLMCDFSRTYKDFYERVGDGVFVDPHADNPVFTHDYTVACSWLGREIGELYRRHFAPED